MDNKKIRRQTLFDEAVPVAQRGVTMFEYTVDWAINVSLEHKHFFFFVFVIFLKAEHSQRPHTQFGDFELFDWSLFLG